MTTETFAPEAGPEGEKSLLATRGAGEGADPADFEWSWGEQVPTVDQPTFQQMWDNRAYTVETPEMAPLGASGGSGGGSLASGAFGGLTDEQAENARIIIEIGQKRGLSRYAQAIAVMTALGESGLRNLDYGDRDSIGMFQERSTYGSVQDRLDPRQTASRFYDRLTSVDGWQKLKPTQVAHKAQRNADPNHYTKWWSQAAGVLQAAYGG